MNIEDGWLWNIHNLRQGDHIGCPICKAFRPHTAWQETQVAYDSCPSMQQAIVCPACGRTFDSFYDTQLNFQVRKAP